jgi:triosephosphate isomerase
VAALAAGLTPIVCVGETLAERDAGATMAVVSRQLDAVLAAVGAKAAKITVAYEPVWAIGTGKTATPDLAQEAHELIKSLYDTRVLYGGSVKPDNAEELLGRPAVDGALVGGASLDPASFTSLCRIAASLS